MIQFKPAQLAAVLSRVTCFRCCSYHRYGEASCDRGKVKKKQRLPLYLHAKTSNCCFYDTFLTLLFYSSFVRVGTVIGYFFRNSCVFTTGKNHSKLSKCKVDCKLTICLQKTQIPTIQFNEKCYTFRWQPAHSSFTHILLIAWSHDHEHVRKTSSFSADAFLSSCCAIQKRAFKMENQNLHKKLKYLINEAVEVRSKAYTDEIKQLKHRLKVITTES